ncbi:hypothetical protein G2W53_008056 [Senna tora]|uniref:Uncharacterized protein n=1 Tax=Senna tora TaxID=362788 RepID=A0A834X7L0_9FABA|nr:hypothetical protein G2W53_008056 [Senna tora]
MKMTKNTELMESNASAGKTNETRLNETTTGSKEPRPTEMKNPKVDPTQMETTKKLSSGIQSTQLQTEITFGTLDPQMSKNLGVLRIDGKFFSLGPILWRIISNLYARICVLVDMAKTIPTCITINGYNQLIEQEGVASFCPKCGSTNHSSAVCKNSEIKQHQQIGKTDEEEWTLVNHHWRPKVNCDPPTPKVNHIQNLNSKPRTKRKAQRMKWAMASKPTNKTSAVDKQSDKELDFDVRSANQGVTFAENIPKVVDLPALSKHKQSEPYAEPISEVGDAKVERCASTSLQIPEYPKASETQRNGKSIPPRPHLSPTNTQPPTSPNLHRDLAPRGLLTGSKDAFNHSHQKCNNPSSNCSGPSTKKPNGTPCCTSPVPMENMGKFDIGVVNSNSIVEGLGLSPGREYFLQDLEPCSVQCDDGAERYGTRADLTPCCSPNQNSLRAKNQPGDARNSHESTPHNASYQLELNHAFSEGKSPIGSIHTGDGESSHRRLHHVLLDARSGNPRPPVYILYTQEGGKLLS